jgi:hypothetical protein
MRDQAYQNHDDARGTSSHQRRKLTGIILTTAGFVGSIVLTFTSAVVNLTNWYLYAFTNTFALASAILQVVNWAYTVASGAHNTMREWRKKWKEDDEPANTLVLDATHV